MGGSHDSGQIKAKHSSTSSRKKIIDSDDESDALTSVPDMTPAAVTGEPTPAFDMEADISTLQPATFSTIQRTPLQPMLTLSWKHSVNIMAEAVLSPLIHICEICDRPILSYGRMIPCKHVFCHGCAAGQSGTCSRCGDRVARVERAGLGTLYMCLHEGARYTNAGCRRTYLSQRDLQAHIKHRHRRSLGSGGAVGPPPAVDRPAVEPRVPPALAPSMMRGNDPRSFSRLPCSRDPRDPRVLACDGAPSAPAGPASTPFVNPQHQFYQATLPPPGVQLQQQRGYPAVPQQQGWNNPAPQPSPGTRYLH